jgi:hypothetical protein
MVLIVDQEPWPSRADVEQWLAELAILRETLAADPLVYGGHRILKGVCAVKPEVFETQLAGLKQLAELLRGQLEDMRRDRDAWRDEARRLALAE